MYTGLFTPDFITSGSVLRPECQANNDSKHFLLRERAGAAGVLPYAGGVPRGVPPCAGVRCPVLGGLLSMLMFRHWSEPDAAVAKGASMGGEGRACWMVKAAP